MPTRAIRNVNDVRRALYRCPFVPIDADYELFVRKGDEWMHESDPVNHIDAIQREVVTVRLVFLGHVRGGVDDDDVADADAGKEMPQRRCCWWQRLLFPSCIVASSRQQPS
jgi:hypothetical protein